MGVLRKIIAGVIAVSIVGAPGAATALPGAPAAPFQITPAAQTRGAMRGTTVTFLHTVSNPNPAARQVIIFTSPLSNGWSASVAPASATIPANGGITVTLVVTVPASATAGRVVAVIVQDAETGDVASAADTVRVPLLFLPLVRGSTPPPPGTDDWEPDDECAQAKPLTLNITHTHTFVSLGGGLDTDYLHYVIPTEGRDPSLNYYFQVDIGSAPGNSRATPYIQAEWPCGDLLGSGGNFGVIFQGKPGTNIWLRITNTQQLTGALTAYTVYAYEIPPQPSPPPGALSEPGGAVAQAPGAAAIRPEDSPENPVHPNAAYDHDMFLP